jgi:hypothetical protein
VAGLLRLAAAMVDRAPEDSRRDNPETPAGYAILAQFIDHDLSFDPCRRAAVRDRGAEDERSPRLALDSLYGTGPDFSPDLYEPGRPWRFAIGAAVGAGRFGPAARGAGPDDLPRAAAGAALIGDPRNDGNLGIAQLHLAFCKAHNAVADRVAAGRSGEERFADARRIVAWHYQWVVMEDFLRRLCDPATLRRVRAGARFFGTAALSLPDEFTGAAFRAVHAMVREHYDLNDLHAADAALPGVGLDRLFRRGGRSGGAEAALGAEWAIDWRRFFAFPQRGDGHPPLNFCRRIEPTVTPGLDSLLDAPADATAAPGRLAARNLLRGREMGLPSGQSVARAMGLTPLTPEQVATGPDGAAAEASGLHRETPLWFYVLKEAQLFGRGRRLGPVASQIVAETLLTVVEETPGSYLAASPSWRPTLPGRVEGRFDIVDLLLLAGDPDPFAASGGLRSPVIRPTVRRCGETAG